MAEQAGLAKAERLAENHRIIWLQPRCCVDERAWCADDPGPCEDCGMPSIKYIRADAMTDKPIFHAGMQEPTLVYARRDQIDRLSKIQAAAERVCWFDWTGNDDDAVRTIDELRKALAAASS